MLPLQLFFDECCSKRLPRKLLEVYLEDYPNIKTQHLTDFVKAGTGDSDWLALLEQEKHWIVVTTDRGKDAKKPKLPVLCSRLGITFISMTPALMNDGYKAHKQALLTVWPQLIRVPLLPKGTRVSLGYHMYNKGLTKAPYLSIDHQAFDIWCHEHGVAGPED